MDFLSEIRWSPYAVGIGIGILSWFSFLISRYPISCSTTFARASGMIEKLFRGKKVAQKLYYQEIKLVIDWQSMLVVGMVIGAFISAQLSGDFDLQMGLPQLGSHLWEHAAAQAGCCSPGRAYSSVSALVGQTGAPVATGSAAHFNWHSQAGYLPSAFSLAVS